jgi:hypothetical protein
VVVRGIAVEEAAEAPGHHEPLLAIGHEDVVVEGMDGALLVGGVRLPARVQEKGGGQRHRDRVLRRHAQGLTEAGDGCLKQAGLPTE